jgi:hypothetical protein
MITALISTVLGLFGGLLPDIMKEVRDTRNATREIEFLKTQHQLQIETAKINADSRLREIDANLAAQEAKATREYLGSVIEAQSKPTGILWIDGFNSVLRPACVSMIMVLFMMTALPFTWSVLHEYRENVIDATTMANTIWTSLVGESIMAVLGFLFGYRSTAKSFSPK